MALLWSVLRILLLALGYSLLILLGLVAVVLLLLCLPAYVRIRYDKEWQVTARVLGIPVRLYPRPKAKKAKRAKASAKPIPKPEEKKGALSGFIASVKAQGLSQTLSSYGYFAKSLLKTAGRLLRGLTIKDLQLYLLVASEDAAKTAENYGKICAAAYPAQALLESQLHIRKRSIVIRPDFLAEKTVLRLDMRIKLWPIRILGQGLRLFFGYIGHTIRTLMARPTASFPAR